MFGHIARPLQDIQAVRLIWQNGQPRLSLFYSDFIDVRDIQSQGTAQDPRYPSHLGLCALIIYVT